MPVTSKDNTGFDPSKYGAVEVKEQPTPTGFDPSKYGAVEVKKKVGGSVSQNGSTTSAPSISTSNENGVDVKKASEENDYDNQNPIDLYKNSQELKDKQNLVGVTGDTGGGAPNFTPDIEAQSKAKEIKDYLKKNGWDENSLQAASDIPEDWNKISGFSKDELAHGLKTNPDATLRKISAAKWQIPLVQYTSDKGGDVAEIQHLIDKGQNQDTDYQSKREANQKLYQIIATSDIPNKDEVLKHLAIDHAYSYGSVANDNPTLQKEKEQYPNLNENQLLGLDYMKDLMPEKAAGYEHALVDPKLLKDNVDAQTGQEEKLKRLEEVGINLKEKNLNEKFIPLKNKFDELYNKQQTGQQLTPDEQQELQSLQDYGTPIKKQLDDLQNQKNDLLVKYPKAGMHDAELFAQELLGQKHTGLNWMALETGKSTENAAQSIFDLVSEPFASDQQSKIRQNEILGNEMNNEESTHLTQENQTTKNFTPTVKAGSDLEKYIDGIKNDTTLSDKQKRDAVTTALMRSPDQWQRTPIEGGKSNIGLTSLLYGTGGLAANLAPFVLAETATGGGATAGFARKFVSNFAAVLGTSYHQEVANNIDKGVADPYTQAAISTGINAIAMGGAQTATEIRKLASGMNSGIGDAIVKLSDDEIMTALKKVPAPLSAFQKTIGFGKNILGAAKEGFKTAAKVQPLLTAGQIVNDANNGELKSFQDYAKQAAIEGLKFGIMGTTLGAIGKIGKEPNELSKAALYQAGADPKAFMDALDQKIENNSINKDDAEQIKNNIEKAEEVFKKVPFVDSKGRPMSERQRRDLLFYKMQENELNENLKKDIPENLVIRTEKQISDLKEKIDKIYKGKYEEPAIASNSNEGNPNQNQPAGGEVESPPILEKEKKTQPNNVEKLVTSKESNPNVGSENKTGLVLYHGSPHSFENFDISKLGSGEGNQAFGRGLYFTNEESIAKGYANKLGSRKNFWEALRDGNKLSLSKEDFDFINKDLDALGFDGGRAEGENLGAITVDGKEEHAPAVLDAMSVLFGKNAKEELSGYDLSPKEIDRLLEIKKKISDPQLYKVAVHEGKSPSEYDYLDWHDKISDEQKKKLSGKLLLNGNDLISTLKDNATGEDVYNLLKTQLGSEKAASDWLLKNGVDGITYKSDKGTGGTNGEGRNYVVFDPKSIRVDEINNQKQASNKPSIIKPNEVKQIQDKEIVPLKNNSVNSQSDVSQKENINSGQDKGNGNNPSEPNKEKTLTEKVKGIEDVTDPYDRALQHFANEGKIHPSEIERLFGNKGDKNSRIGIIKNDAPTVKELAHQLWETDNTGKHDDRDYVNAIERVLTDFNSKAAMQKDLVDRYDYESAAKKYFSQLNEPEHEAETSHAIDIISNMSEDEINHLLQLDSDKNKADELENYINDLQNKNSKTPPPETPKPDVVSNEGEEEPISTKKIINQQKAREFGLGKVPIPKLGTETEEISAAKERVDSGKSNPLELVSKILNTPDIKDIGLSVNDRADMQYYMLQLKQRSTELSKQLLETENILKADPTNKEAQESNILLTQQSADHSDNYINAVRANEIGSNVWGKSGNVMQIELGEQGQILQRIQRIKDWYGNDVPPVIKERLDAIQKTLDKANATISELQTKFDKLSVEHEALKIQSEKPKQRKTSADFKDERKDIIKDIQQALKKARGEINVTPIPYAKELVAITPHVIKLFKSYAAEGINKVEDIVNKIHEDLLAYLPALTKKDVEDVLIGEYKNTKKPVEKNSEYIKAQKAKDNAMFMLRHLEKVAMNSRKNLYMKGLDFALKWERTAIFALNTNVFVKLNSAALYGSFLHRPIEFAAGKLINNSAYKLLPRLQKEAPIEGNENLESLAKFYGEFLDPIKFADNTWQIYSKGESRLTQELSQKHAGTNQYVYKNPLKQEGVLRKANAALGYIQPVLEVYTNTHAVIKDPVKRATFESSMINILNWYKQNKLDITHPLILENARQYSYRRAEYEIFQENNKASGKINSFFNQLEKNGILENKVGGVYNTITGNAKYTAAALYHFFVPISTVAINLTRRLGLGLALPFNIAKAINLEKGIKELAPEQSDLILRQLKKGATGAAYWTLGFFLYQNAGGIWNRFDPDKKRKTDLKTDRLHSDQMEFGGVDIPKNVQHTIQLQAFQFGATARNVYYHYKTQLGEPQYEALGASTLATLSGFIDGIPPAKEAVKLMESINDPYMAGKVGNDIKRSIGINKLQELGILPKSETNGANGSFGDIKEPKEPKEKTVLKYQ